jgi:hypothetical protein
MKPTLSLVLLITRNYAHSVVVAAGRLIAG